MFGALLGAAGGAGSAAAMSGLLGGKDPGKAQLAQILGIYKQLQGQQQGLYANAMQQQKKGLKAVQGGYDKALKETGNLGYSAKQSVLGREKQNLGMMQQGLTQSGLGSTSVAQNLQRGVYSDTNRSLGDIDAQIAQIRSGLLAQQGNAVGGQYGALAGLFQNQSSAQVGLGQSMIGTLGGVQHQDPNAWMGNLIQGGMQILPFLGGGGGGAGGFYYPDTYVGRPT